MVLLHAQKQKLVVTEHCSWSSNSSLSAFQREDNGFKPTAAKFVFDKILVINSLEYLNGTCACSHMQDCIHILWGI